MDLVKEIRDVIAEIRKAGEDGRVTLRELVGIMREIGDLLVLLGQLLPPAVEKKD